MYCERRQRGIWNFDLFCHFAAENTRRDTMLSYKYNVPNYKYDILIYCSLLLLDYVFLLSYFGKLLGEIWFFNKSFKHCKIHTPMNLYLKQVQANFDL